MTDTQLIAKYSGPVPRYTSYPTAPQFHDGVKEADYRTWLADIPSERPLSLYFHIPYCDTLCWFCGCMTKITERYLPVTNYLARLLREIELTAEALGTKRLVEHIHWGGGSPTILKPGDVLRLAEQTAKHFDLMDRTDFAVEIDPRGVTLDMARALADAGVSRASIGIQDFNPLIQKLINRVQPFDETKEVVINLRREGIANINLDLMYGLPHQKVSHVARTVELALSLTPSRLALFGYAHVPWMKKHQRLINEEHLPDAALRLEQSEYAAQMILDAGYVRIGLDHFAHPEDEMAIAYQAGRLKRNFQGYTTDQAENLIGFGASAIGVSDGGYVQNHTAIHEYERSIDHGRLPIARGVAVSGEDHLRRSVIQELMCHYAVDLDLLLNQHDPASPDAQEFFESELAGMTDLIADGLMELEDSIITVTEAGKPFVRVICARFDQYLGNEKGRHSAAV
ncbi:oxygen-independent coproporphyrinogen III oxidase [Aestuariispira insulae]|uniref:Coproporphyrinogen-III oxidase n=1 Tax=Aestuariispira insulae TaxID=1461337 RepID=A0A3D9HX85_9PROT|nr:oxygen-independent coproporphyrinogen III oxidase [Aestuariispira insulae]RED54029.1 anaerobic coproporphyrinogen III oxidase [Aestuariispira insulae]